MPPMTSRERVLTALNHEEPDRVPLILGVDLTTGIRMRAHLGAPGEERWLVDDSQPGGGDGAAEVGNCLARLVPVRSHRARRHQVPVRRSALGDPLRQVAPLGQTPGGIAVDVHHPDLGRTGQVRLVEAHEDQEAGVWAPRDR